MPPALRARRTASRVVADDVGAALACARRSDRTNRSGTVSPLPSLAESDPSLLSWGAAENCAGLDATGSGAGLMEGFNPTTATLRSLASDGGASIFAVGRA